jgi:hypothetical protein
MGKARNSNEENTSGGECAVHLVLQGKCGAGKSVAASWLAEFLIGRGKPVRCIDGKPVSRSLAQYKALAAESFELMNRDGLIERWRYDALVERFAATDAVVILDSGATAFLSLWGFIVESAMILVPGKVGRKVCLHVPVTGKENLNDTLPCFSTIATAAPDKSIEGKMTIERAWRHAIAPDAARVPLSCNSHGLDRRYFGPVPTSAIRDRLRPLVRF